MHYVRIKYADRVNYYKCEKKSPAFSAGLSNWKLYYFSCQLQVLLS